MPFDTITTTTTLILTNVLPYYYAYRFRYIAFEQDGKLISDPSRIAEAYYKGDFAVHLLCSVPFALLLFSGTRNRIVYAWSRLQYLILLHNANSVFQSVAAALQWFGVRVNSSYQKVAGITLIIWFVPFLIHRY